MELVYLYIRDYKGFLRNVEVNFSSNYIVKFVNNELRIEGRKRTIKNYYGENISNISLFLGKNGMGKTTLLDILGMTRNARATDAEYSHSTDGYSCKVSYFILYKLFDDYYGIEFVEDSFLEGSTRIKNLVLGNQTTNGALYKVPMGLIFKYKNEKFFYVDNIFSNWLDRNNCESCIKYFYISNDYQSSRLIRGMSDEELGYLFERQYLSSRYCNRYKYKYFSCISDADCSEVLDDKIIINNTLDKELNYVSYGSSDLIEAQKAELKNKLDEVMELPKSAKKLLQSPKEKVSIEQKHNNKFRFLKLYIGELIEYHILETLPGWLNVDYGTAGNHTYRSYENNSFIDKVISEISKTDKTYQALTNILYKILIEVDKIANQYTRTAEKELTSLVINSISILPEEVFIDERSIQVSVKEEYCNFFDELLKNIDLCFENIYRDGYNNSIEKTVEVVMPKMSEGQKNYLELFSKTLSCIIDSKETDGVVILIDEPDKSLHPEAARRFIDLLVKEVNDIDLKRNVQFVISSHSPFIVSDILPDYVTVLKKYDDGEVRACDGRNTYASNIYNLLMDPFMLDNTLGEYSYRKIKDIMHKLDESDSLSMDEKNNIRTIVDMIGERIIQKRLQDMLDKQEMNNKKNLCEMILREDDEDKLELVKALLLKND